MSNKTHCNTNKSKTAYMVLAGLFAALTAMCSWISIPLGFTPVPMNLATLAVLLAGGLLGAKYGALSLTVYVLVGSVGAPVFAGFRGGLSVLAGPTGGFLLGYIAAAFIVGRLLPIMEATFKRGCHGCFLRGGKLCRLTVSTAKASPVHQESTASQVAKSNEEQPEHHSISQFSKYPVSPQLCIVGYLHYAVALIVGLIVCYVLGVLWFMVSTNAGFTASLLACAAPFVPGEIIKVITALLLIRKLKPHIHLYS